MEQSAGSKAQSAKSKGQGANGGGRRTENGARRLRRFTVRRLRKLEMTGLLSFRALKRRERRAPHSARSCHPLARDSRLLAVSPDAVQCASTFDVRCSACSLLPAPRSLLFASGVGRAPVNSL